MCRSELTPRWDVSDSPCGSATTCTTTRIGHAHARRVAPNDQLPGCAGFSLRLDHRAPPAGHSRARTSRCQLITNHPLKMPNTTDTKLFTVYLRQTSRVGIGSTAVSVVRAIDQATAEATAVSDANARSNHNPWVVIDAEMLPADTGVVYFYENEFGT